MDMNNRVSISVRCRDFSSSPSPYWLLFSDEDRLFTRGLGAGGWTCILQKWSCTSIRQ